MMARLETGASRGEDGVRAKGAYWTLSPLPNKGGGGWFGCRLVLFLVAASWVMVRPDALESKVDDELCDKGVYRPPTLPLNHGGSAWRGSWHVRFPVVGS